VHNLAGDVPPMGGSRTHRRHAGGRHAHGTRTGGAARYWVMSDNKQVFGLPRVQGLAPVRSKLAPGPRTGGDASMYYQHGARTCQSECHREYR
jgi:hypothetical protein